MSTVIGLLLCGVATAWAGELASLHQHQRIVAAGEGPARQPTVLPRTPQGLIQLQPLPWERPVPDIARLGLERTKCLGNCPAYTVIILADGTFTYSGSANVERMGEHGGTVPRWFLDRVLRYVDEIEFMDIDATFDPMVLDAPSAYTMVEWGDTTHVVLNAASAAPSVVWVLERLIDDMLELATWE
ncbi:MAG TPA: DUF6438 domain-containing protein [Trueperaceae bacterium]|nr:DUF6438 domain-containing protein [Trueperaceae bacterium]